MEAKQQLLISVPMMIINLSFYLIPVISVMFAGHIGDLEFAGSNLAHSWSTATGLIPMIGLSGALETLCGQAFGAQLFNKLGIYLQSSCIISISVSVCVAILWWFTEPILIILHQSPPIAEAAALYINYLIPGIFAYGFIQNILRFLQTQSVLVLPLACSLLPLFLHVGIAYLLTHHTSLGYRGAPLATSLSMWASLFMLVLYVKFSKKLKLTYTGLSLTSFGLVFMNLKLALPSAAMVCLEYWSFEILVILAGLMPNSKTTTPLIAMCVNTEAIAFMFTYGLSAAVSTRVSNELGALNPTKAKQAMWVSLKLSVCLSLLVVASLVILRNVWAGLFSSNSNIITAFSTMLPFLGVSIMLDSVQGVISGVSRGCGWQHLAMYVNLATFYFVGMPVACVLAFHYKMYTKGLWIGLICGLCCQTGALLLVAMRKNWMKLELLNASDEIPLAVID